MAAVAGARALLLLVPLLLAVQVGTAAVASDHSQSYAPYFNTLRNPKLLAAATRYQQVMQHKHSLSSGALQRSLVYRGANLRLRKVLDKLMTGGQDVRIGAIGGSITCGHRVTKGVDEWFSLFSNWVNATFSTAKLSFKNGCVPATQSEYVSMCLDQFVDEDVDVIFVEYAANDGYTDGSVNNGAVAAFERLLRKLLLHKRAPAVVLFEFLATDAKQKQLPFYATAEDHYGVLAQYYGLPWLSYRNLVWQGLMQDVPGFSRFEIFPQDEQRHPTPLGHRYMADMAVHLMQQTYLDSVLAPMDEQTVQQHPLTKVPQPMLPGNYETSNLACITGDDLRSVVVQQQGNWSWIYEGTAAKPKLGYVSWQVGATLVLKVDTCAAVPKTEATIIAANSQLHRTENSQDQAPEQPAAALQPSTSSDNATPDMIIWVGYVKSWRHMGSATISCISGCHCQPSVVDGLHAEGNTQQHLAKLFATQAQECLVEVKINSWTRSKEHKFKVTGIMVSRYVRYNGEGDFTDSVLLNTMADNAAAAATAADKL